MKRFKLEFTNQGLIVLVLIVVAHSIHVALLKQKIRDLNQEVHEALVNHLDDVLDFRDYQDEINAELISILNQLKK